MWGTWHCNAGITVLQICCLMKEPMSIANTAHIWDGLAIASGNLNMDMVTLLLDRGADINALGGEMGSPLQAASSAYYVIGMKVMRVEQTLMLEMKEAELL
ncbi:hypothetical protein RJZ56_003645 [Blastomyces dermatitidis]|uniref:Uncharacterized protein n=3 Tax=Blastomyces TaxID=229219 RepID=A0A179U9C2_BLAGS|nr:uncharacterized protein BDBG_00247 [Blastomyces gilchristii SLH14081]XP_045272982.1 uncharacterized protein BDCG_08437 [Blastomyces dermatitidis ER-3]EGE78223.1 hypothetical protein BDDG_01160 [Blastomyces dermatitidis ATCC 18188]EQL31244.1 hypothetical protein BDFG_06417 [Blastomyces dermatitidis ATCC 26199]EEQ85168.2 hypothetical protein BDCG_08437 [Blastomyces dermatitidis ER-3]OAT03541.1 hypothetical protein BDBG_00247 [Blastomyces gilchristii SLH14081]